MDDDSTHRRILDEILKHWSMVPELAPSGREELSTLGRAAAAGTPFQLVLLGSEMPEMDVFAGDERSRDNPGVAGATVMMLNSAGQRGDFDRCRELGIPAYLTKPARQSEPLEDILNDLVKSRIPGSSATAVTQSTLQAGWRKLHVLLVEDNEVNQQLVVRSLEKRGHHVTLAWNGREALAYSQQSTFDVVLMDVQTQVMDGFEATAAIRKQEALSGGHLRIVAMTAQALPGDRERCLAAGMDAYTGKPLQVHELIEMVEATASGQSPEEPKTATSIPIFDRAEALNRLQGDEELLTELAQVFLADYPRQLRDIRDAIEREDVLGLEHATHALKGAVGNFDARRAFDAALELERTARRRNLVECRRLYGVLEREMKALGPELSRLGAVEAQEQAERPPEG